MDAATLAMMAATAVAGLACGFVLGKRQERAGARQVRVQLYPTITTAMNVLVDAVEATVPKATPGMDERSRARLRTATESACTDFRRAWQGHAAVLPGQVVVALWAVNDAYRQLAEPSSVEQIALAGLVVLAAARDEAMRAIRADARPDVR
jgi:hypothetical protein